MVVMEATVAMGTTAMEDMGVIMIMVMALVTMAGKGTAGVRASTGGSRRGTSRTDWRDQGYDYNATATWNSGDTY
ncbi:putative RNA-binding protein squid-like 3 [Homarus americanus]|uniref:Putative RNA-binding protein squid-like 3 n=1 Tax=Homarus americanus TaxID=6706 RepID=A0A8J5T080_HOMAM|nr:putative RNA-binding protein squid-like 3 [Homarus americanus]